MRFKPAYFFFLFIGAQFLDATNVKVIVEQNTNGRPRISDAEACLLASDGSVRKQNTNGNGVTIFNNVSIGNTTVRAFKSGFVQGTVTQQVQSVAEEVVTLTLNSGNAAPQACNLQNARDIMGAFTIVPPNPIPPGGNATYRFTVSNIGQSNAGNVVARIDLPLGFGFPNFNQSSASLTCGVAGGGGAPFRITCNPATVNPGSPKIVIFTSLAPSNINNTQNFTVQAVVDPNNTVIEGNETNNTTSTTTTVSHNAAADLHLDLSGSDTQVFLYDEYKYLVKVSNGGSTGAASVVARVTLPKDASFVRFENNTFNSCPRDGQVINCQANSMIPNDERSVKIVMKPKQTTPGGRLMLMTAAVDPDHTVVETNDQDNTGGVTTTTDIRQVDFEISQLTDDTSVGSDNRFIKVSSEKRFIERVPIDRYAPHPRLQSLFGSHQRLCGAYQRLST